MTTTLDHLTDEHPHAVCLRDALITTFAMVCGADPQYTGPVAQNDTGDQILGIISLVGDYSWALALCLPRDTAESLARTFAGFDIPFDSDDMGDVVGELCNVYAGSASARLEGIGVRVELSLPTVVRGSNVSLPLPEGLRTLCLGFQTGDGPFFLKLVAGDPRTMPCRRPGM